jgi:hypothetical protein
MVDAVLEKIPQPFTSQNRFQNPHDTPQSIPDKLSKI